MSTHPDETSPPAEGVPPAEATPEGSAAPEVAIAEPVSDGSSEKPEPEEPGGSGESADRSALELQCEPELTPLPAAAAASAPALERLTATIRPAAEAAREWAARRPEFVASRRPAWTWATNGAVAGFGGVALILVLVTGLAFTGGSPAGTAAPGSSPSPEVGSATIAPPTDTFWVPSPSAPILFPLATPIASIECRSYPGRDPAPVVVGGKTYAVCGRDVVVVNMTTNQVERTYKNAYSLGELADCDDGCPAGNEATGFGLAVDHGIWVSETYPTQSVMRRIDARSGKVTYTREGTILGDLNGRLLVGEYLDASMSDYYSAEVPEGQVLVLVDAVSGQDGDWAGDWSGRPEDVAVGCGSIWQFDPGQAVTYVTRLNSSGARTWSFSVDGSISAFGQVGKECWVAVASDQNYFMRLGGKCVDASSSGFLGPIDITAGAFWMVPDQAGLTYQRVNPEAWQPMGDAFEVGGQQAFGAYQQVWLRSPDRLARVGLTLEDWTYTPKSALRCPAPDPTDEPPYDEPPYDYPSEEPWPLSTPTPNPSPTRSPTSKPTATPTPTPTATPTETATPET